MDNQVSRPVVTNKAIKLGAQTQRNGESPQGNGARATYYDILGVDHQAGADTLAEAYSRLRTRYHPMRNPYDPLAPDIIRYLDSAFAVLIDPDRRRAYDAVLGNLRKACRYPKLC